MLAHSGRRLIKHQVPGVRQRPSDLDPSLLTVGERERVSCGQILKESYLLKGSPYPQLLIAGTKTNAADREFQMLPAVKQELAAHRQTARFSAPDDLVFCTETGKQQSRSNTLSRVLKPAIRRANVELVANGFVPIPVDKGRGKSLSQHGLRHTHISLRCALGEDDIATIARDVGHRDPATTLRIYTHVMDLDQASRERLTKLVNCGLKRHVKARSPSEPTAEHGENPDGHGWFRTSVSRQVMNLKTHLGRSSRHAYKMPANTGFSGGLS